MALLSWPVHTHRIAFNPRFNRKNRLEPSTRIVQGFQLLKFFVILAKDLGGEAQLAIFHRKIFGVDSVTVKPQKNTLLESVNTAEKLGKNSNSVAGFIVISSRPSRSSSIA